ncbi:carbohydrate-binding protein [Pontibacter sp. G13]|uniref:carbohydrate-binding protein n=1 Tax=Pontibacter sp. G13 TaxID=3074898 RepID=UPI00288A144C|nr:carbohydrate-binding protein [Pontibacter sp. G13]WNJ19120.1 carbohydrate-binding protein [Pontibacter sp. G13]
MARLYFWSTWMGKPALGPHSVRKMIYATSFILLISMISMQGMAQNCISAINFPGGRVAMSFDGNVHDDDDIVALPFSLAFWWAAGLQDKVVHVEYNNHVCDHGPESDGTGAGAGDDYANMRTSANGSISRFGYNSSIIYDYSTQASAAESALAAEINASTSSDPLWIICAGPMETVYRAIDAANSGYNHVTLISHSKWNQNHTDCPNDHNWADIVSDFGSLGIRFVESCGGPNTACNNTSNPLILYNQNGHTNLADNDFNTAKSQWSWMNGHSTEYIQWLYDRNPFGGKFDPSDAGMSYYLITGGPDLGGDERGNSSKAQTLLENPCSSSGGGGGTPGDITDLSATAVNCSTVTLTWSDESGETAYRIRRKLSSESTFTTLGDVNADILTYTDNSVQENLTYLYQVRPVVNNTAVAISNNPSVQIPACGSGGGGGSTPGDISDLAAVATGCGSVTLSWSDESGEDGYRIRRKVTGTSSYINLTDVSANTTSYQDNTVSANTSYTYMVRARLNNANVGISNTPNVDVPACGGGGTGAPIPGLLEAEDYDAMSGIQTENTSDAGGGQNVGFINNGDYLDFDVNVASAGTYTVMIRVATSSSGGTIQIKQGSTILGTASVSNTGGWQSWTTVSTSVSLAAGSQTLRMNFVGGSGFLFNVNWFDFSAGGARKAQAQAPRLQIQPNPTQGFIQISGPESGQPVQIFDLSGKLVMETGFSPKLNVASLPKGIYLVKITGFQPEKLIRQ